MMKRDQALKILGSRVSDQIVVPVFQTCFDWMALNPRDLNYVATGAMGQASSHGLGLALASPEKKIWILDGDGSLLMNLGSLVTIGEAAPANFHHFVFANRIYEVNGEHPTPGKDKVDFSGIAMSSGYRHARCFSDLVELENNLDSFLETPGPGLAVMHIEAGEPWPRDYEYIHSAAARDRFRKAINQN